MTESAPTAAASSVAEAEGILLDMPLATINSLIASQITITPASGPPRVVVRVGHGERQDSYQAHPAAVANYSPSDSFVRKYPDLAAAGFNNRLLVSLEDPNCMCLQYSW